MLQPRRWRRLLAGPVVLDPAIGVAPEGAIKPAPPPTCTWTPIYAQSWPSPVGANELFGIAGYDLDGAEVSELRLAAECVGPSSLAVDPQGNVYVNDPCGQARGGRGLGILPEGGKGGEGRGLGVGCKRGRRAKAWEGEGCQDEEKMK